MSLVKGLCIALWSQPLGKAGVAGLSLLAVLGLASLRWTPYQPDALAGPTLAPPSQAHLLGTNGLGQDILSQVLAGCRTSLIVAISVGISSTTLGFIVGAAAGFYPKRLGLLLMRAVDGLMAIPRLPLIILLAVFLRPRLVNVIVVLIFLSWPGIARIFRAQVLSIRERDYMRFVRFSGGGFAHVVGRHLWKELLPLLLAKITATAAHAVLVEAGLSFLGLGDPTLKTWGSMIRSGLDYPGLLWTPAWSWWLLPPSCMVSLTVLSFALIGYGLDDALQQEARG